MPPFQLAVIYIVALCFGICSSASFELNFGNGCPSGIMPCAPMAANLTFPIKPQNVTIIPVNGGGDPQFPFVCELDDPTHYSERVDITFKRYRPPTASKRQYEYSIEEISKGLADYMSGCHCQTFQPVPPIINRRQWSFTTARPKIRFIMGQLASSPDELAFWMLDWTLECAEQFVGLWDAQVQVADIEFDLIRHHQRIQVATGSLGLNTAQDTIETQ